MSENNCDINGISLDFLILKKKILAYDLQQSNRVLLLYKIIENLLNFRNKRRILNIFDIILILFSEKLCFYKISKR